MPTYYKSCEDSDFVYRIDGNSSVTRVFADGEVSSLFNLKGILNMVSYGMLEMMSEQEYITFMTLRELEK